MRSALLVSYDAATATTLTPIQTLYAVGGCIGLCLLAVIAVGTWRR